MMEKNMKEAYINGLKSIGRKVGSPAVFTDITWRGALPEEASIHIAEMTAIKTEMKEKRGHKMGNIYRLVELNAGHQEQQNYPILNWIWHTSRAP